MSDLLFSEATRYWIGNQQVLRNAEACYRDEWERVIGEAASRAWPGAKAEVRDPSDQGHAGELVWRPHPAPARGPSWQITLRAGLGQARQGCALAALECLDPADGERARPSADLARLAQEDLAPVRAIVPEWFGGWRLTEFEQSRDAGAPVGAMIPLAEAPRHLPDLVFQRFSGLITYADVAGIRHGHEVALSLHFHPQPPPYVVLTDYRGRKTGAKLSEQGRIGQLCLLIDCAGHTLKEGGRGLTNLHFRSYHPAWVSVGCSYRIVLVAKSSRAVEIQNRLHLQIGSDPRDARNFPVLAEYTIALSSSREWQVIATPEIEVPAQTDDNHQKGLREYGIAWIANVYGDAQDLLIDHVLLLWQRKG